MSTSPFTPKGGTFSAAAPGQPRPARDDLQRSRLLRDAFGDALIDAFVAVRRYELSTYAAKPINEVVPLMRWVY